MAFDIYYAIACTIIQTFDDHYPYPTADSVWQAIQKASEICGSLDMNKIIKWAEDYATEWYEKYMK